jgi:hypothetical protein
MRIIGILPDEKRVGNLIDSLRNAGIKREDIIVSDVYKTKKRESVMDKVYIKTETESVSNTTAFTDFLKRNTNFGIVVAVELPKHEACRIQEIMEQNGAKLVFQD